MQLLERPRSTPRLALPQHQPSLFLLVPHGKGSEVSRQVDGCHGMGLAVFMILSLAAFISIQFISSTSSRYDSILILELLK